MALLTPEQIQRLQQIIRDSSTALAIATTGYEVSPEELQRLVDEGYLDPSKLDNVVLDSFSFGQLMTRMDEAKSMSYPEFQKYLAKNPVPMTPVERQAYDTAKARAGTYCVGLGNRYNQELGTVIINADSELAAKTRKIIRDETATAIARRETVGQLKTRLGQATGDWARDWHRIAATETQLAHQEGLLNQVTKDYGEDALLAKIPEPGACEHCERLYLENGRPMVRPASWWHDQGASNVGRKTADWKPVMGAMHPHCFPAGYRVTTNRGEILIEQISVGDRVLSAEGNWRRVCQSFKRFYRGPLVKIRTADHELRSTPNHLFRDCCGWLTADSIREGGHLRELMLAEPDDRPTTLFEPVCFSRILFGFSSAGVPITAIDFNGDLAFPIYEIDQETADNLVMLERQASTGKGVSEQLFKLRKNRSFDQFESTNDFAVRLDAAPNCFMSSSGELLALIGGKELHADLIRFRSIARSFPSILDSLGDGASCHPNLAGYRLYGEIILEVKSDNLSSVEITPIHSVRINQRIVDVKSIHQNEFEGWVYNIGVEGDESYIVEGLAVHNCRCQLVRVPAGWGFDENGDLMPGE